jgi:hypothetical protein
MPSLCYSPMWAIVMTIQFWIALAQYVQTIKPSAGRIVAVGGDNATLFQCAMLNLQHSTFVHLLSVPDLFGADATGTLQV